MFCMVLLAATVFAGCSKSESPWDQSAGDTTTEDTADDSADMSSLSGEAAYAKEEPEDNAGNSDHYYDEQDTNASDEEFYFDDNNADYNYPGSTPDNNEEYGEYTENPFVSPYEAPLSTFSIDVDTASYSHIRRYLENG